MHGCLFSLLDVKTNPRREGKEVMRRRKSISIVEQRSFWIPIAKPNYALIRLPCKKKARWILKV
jgi:hypothetical protein